MTSDVIDKEVKKTRRFDCLKALLGEHGIPVLYSYETNGSASSGNCLVNGVTEATALSCVLDMSRFADKVLNLLCGARHCSLLGDNFRVEKRYYVNLVKLFYVVFKGDITADKLIIKNTFTTIKQHALFLVPYLTLPIVKLLDLTLSGAFTTTFSRKVNILQVYNSLNQENLLFDCLCSVHDAVRLYRSSYLFEDRLMILAASIFSLFASVQRQQERVMVGKRRAMDSTTTPYIDKRSVCVLSILRELYAYVPVKGGGAGFSLSFFLATKQVTEHLLLFSNITTYYQLSMNYLAATRDTASQKLFQVTQRDFEVYLLATTYLISHCSARCSALQQGKKAVVCVMEATKQQQRAIFYVTRFQRFCVLCFLRVGSDRNPPEDKSSETLTTPGETPWHWLSTTQLLGSYLEMLGESFILFLLLTLKVKSVDEIVGTRWKQIVQDILMEYLSCSSVDAAFDALAAAVLCFCGSSVSTKATGSILPLASRRNQSDQLSETRLSPLLTGDIQQKVPVIVIAVRCVCRAMNAKLSADPAKQKTIIKQSLQFLTSLVEKAEDLCLSDAETTVFKSQVLDVFLQFEFNAPQVKEIMLSTLSEIVGKHEKCFLLHFRKITSRIRTISLTPPVGYNQFVYDAESRELLTWLPVIRRLKPTFAVGFYQELLRLIKEIAASSQIEVDTSMFLYNLLVEAGNTFSSMMQPSESLGTAGSDGHDCTVFSAQSQPGCLWVLLEIQQCCSEHLLRMTTLQPDLKLTVRTIQQRCTDLMEQSWATIEICNEAVALNAEQRKAKVMCLRTLVDNSVRSSTAGESLFRCYSQLLSELIQSSEETNIELQDGILPGEMMAFILYLLSVPSDSPTMRFMGRILNFLYTKLGNRSLLQHLQSKAQDEVSLLACIVERKTEIYSFTSTEKCSSSLSSMRLLLSCDRYSLELVYQLLVSSEERVGAEARLETVVKAYLGCKKADAQVCIFNLSKKVDYYLTLLLFEYQKQEVSEVVLEIKCILQKTVELVRAFVKVLEATLDQTGFDIYHRAEQDNPVGALFSKILQLFLKHSLGVNILHCLGMHFLHDIIDISLSVTCGPIISKLATTRRALSDWIEVSGVVDVSVLLKLLDAGLKNVSWIFFQASCESSPRQELESWLSSAVCHEVVATLDKIRIFLSRKLQSCQGEIVELQSRYETILKRLGELTSAAIAGSIFQLCELTKQTYNERLQGNHRLETTRKLLQKLLSACEATNEIDAFQSMLSIPSHVLGTEISAMQGVLELLHKSFVDGTLGSKKVLVSYLRTLLIALTGVASKSDLKQLSPRQRARRLRTERKRRVRVSLGSIVAIVEAVTNLESVTDFCREMKLFYPGSTDCSSYVTPVKQVVTRYQQNSSSNSVRCISPRRSHRKRSRAKQQEAQAQAHVSATFVTDDTFYCSRSQGSTEFSAPESNADSATASERSSEQRKQARNDFIHYGVQQEGGKRKKLTKRKEATYEEELADLEDFVICETDDELDYSTFTGVGYESCLRTVVHG